jgi:hypothetical protein
MNKNNVCMMLVLSCFNMFAMELALQITPEEKKSFSLHLGMAIDYGDRMINEQKIDKNNAIQSMLLTMSQYLTDAENDLEKMILINNLDQPIVAYKKVDSNPVVQFAINQVRANGGFVSDAQTYIVRTRRILSGQILQQKYPAYSNAWIGELQSGARINYMQRNYAYPSHDIDAVKDFIALFIYQNLLAQKTDEFIADK